MEKIDRIALADVLDEHFCALSFETDVGVRVPEARVYKNKRFRTLEISTYTRVKGKKRRIVNLLELKNYGVHQKLLFSYTEEHVQRVAVSLVEGHLGQLSFGWADIYEGALFLVIDLAKAKTTPFRVAKWLNRHVEHPALTLEGNRFMRVSFSSENDFVLTRLKFS